MTAVPSPTHEIRFRDVVAFAAGFWRRQPVRLACVCGLFITGAIIETNMPNALSAFLGAIRKQQATDIIIFYLAIFIANFFVHVMLRNSAYRVYNRFETVVFKNLVDDVFVHVHQMSDQFLINTFAGSIISRITRARSRIETFQDQLFLRIMSTGVVLIGSAGFLFLRFPVLAILILVYVVLLISISMMLVTFVIGPSQIGYAAAQDTANARLADCISSIATTKVYAQEAREIAGYKAATEYLRVKNLRAYLAGNITGFVQSCLLGGMLTLLLGGGTWYFLHGKANIEDMAYLTLAYTIIQSYLRELSFNLKDLLTASYDLHGVIELMREEPGVKDGSHAVGLIPQGGEITFTNVRFTYPGKLVPVFDNLSLTIKSGERVALVGHSGSGKTSFVRLVQRLYDIQQGAIRIDGQDVTSVTQHSLRSQIATVPQDPILFHRSLKENIAYGKPSATLEEVRAAAQQAHIDDFVMSLPEQYETYVGERGVKLSGGERQRVAIARAILADRPILILDEATSSLDSVSERAIQDALHTLTKGRTSIMIAHRLSTILESDRILVFDGGQIVEQGTHSELLSNPNGIYAGFFKLQSGGFIGD